MLTRQILVATLAWGISNFSTVADKTLTKPIATSDLVFEEKDGLLAFEAEHFFKQSLDDKRAWYLTTRDRTPGVRPDGDDPHIAGASGGAYLELLPDTRRSHGDKLIKGENFSNEPGKMAVLSYKVHINTPGRYRIWARALSTTSEDNGFHIGLDGNWPESGQRWQTVVKNRWHWESKQRTAKVHTGVPGRLWLDIKEAGEHTIDIALREDGIELDKLLFASNFDYEPKGLGPEPKVKTGKTPETFPFVKAKPAREKKQADKKPRSREPALASVGRGDDGNGSITIGGELKQWHKVTLTMDGPFAHENDKAPNPFSDYSMTVRFTHESGAPVYDVPGYFAADGNAGETSASSGTKWRAHLSPDKTGNWSYELTMSRGPNAAIGEAAKAKVLAQYSAKKGSFKINPSDKSGRDLRARGRLKYVGDRYLRFAGSGDCFLKAGADAPETLMAYADFDGTEARKPNKAPLKKWKAHVRDWNEGDPTWKNGKGKGLIGALNYLSGKGCNVFSFLPYNAGGDGDNVWPFNAYGEKFHYDCSKLDQWGILFDHAKTRGLYLHFKLQETENDDERHGHKDAKHARVPAALDGGDLGPERKLYLRELIARFGHGLALNWNLGEENTQTTEQQMAMINYIAETDPYDHNIVVHTFPDQQDKVYRALIGDKSKLTGISIQNSNLKDCHWQTVKWVTESAKAGKPWIVAFDEPGSAQFGMPADPDYPGSKKIKEAPTVEQTRKQVLWGVLLAGGTGVEYYFGYKLPQNDLVCEDWRSRDKSWDYCRIALKFFRDHKIPVNEMKNADALVGNEKHGNEAYCFAKTNELYLVYLPEGGSRDLDLSGAEGEFDVQWFNPRDGGPLQKGSSTDIEGGASASLTAPSKGRDWLGVVRKK